MNLPDTRRHRSRLSAARLLLIAACTAAIVLSGAGSALADVTIWPKSWNGQKVYLSQACHGELGSSACRENLGCDSYQENFWSTSWADKAARGGTNVGGSSLIDRGYAVRIGNAGVNANINSSNAWGSTMHIPLHSNAARSLNCPSNNPASGGTWILHESNNGLQLANQLLGALYIGPGSNDQVMKATDLGELGTGVRAVSAYMETEFHTWSHGVTFLADPWQHSWRVGLAVDRCRGYPRDNNNDQPTAQKHCTW